MIEQGQLFGESTDQPIQAPADIEQSMNIDSDYLASRAGVLQLLSHWQTLGWLRPLDFALAKLFGQLDPNAVAFLSSVIGHSVHQSSVGPRTYLFGSANTHQRSRSNPTVASGRANARMCARPTFAASSRNLFNRLANQLRAQSTGAQPRTYAYITIGFTGWTSVFAALLAV